VSPEELAERAFNALIDNDYGQYDELITLLSLTLGPRGLNQLKQRFIGLSQEPLEKPKDRDRKVIGLGGSGPLYADDIRHAVARVSFASRWRKSPTRKATWMPTSRNRATKRGRSPRLPLTPLNAFSRRVALRKRGAPSTPSMKAGPARFRDDQIVDGSDLRRGRRERSAGALELQTAPPDRAAGAAH